MEWNDTDTYDTALKALHIAEYNLRTARKVYDEAEQRLSTAWNKVLDIEERQQWKATA
jgi:predicted metal-dependent hydrolase